MTEDTAKRVVLESLSALVDDEASELELHRILRESENNAEIRATWARYQRVSAALKGETPPGEYVDLSSRISDAITGLPPLEIPLENRNQAAGVGGKGWWRSAGRFAIAATVAGVVVFAAQQSSLLQGEGTDGLGSGAAVAESDPAPDPVQADHTRPVSALPTRQVSTLDESGGRLGGFGQTDFIPRSPEQRIPNDVIQKRLNQLMLEHAEHAAQNSGRGMLPFARIPRVDEE